MINLLYTLSFYAVLVGMVLTLVESIQAKKWKKTFYIFFIPFYAIYYVLKMEEDNPYKKYTSILVLGAFIIFFFMSILKLLFLTPS